MEFDATNIAFASTGPLLFGAIHGFKLYLGLRSERFRLSAKKSKRFNELMKSGRWRTASPMELQSAFVEAFGYELDDRHIRFALERHRPLPLFRELRRCAGMVRLTQDGKGFERANGLKFKRWAYRRHSQLAFALGFIPYVGFMAFGAHLTGLVSKPHLAMLLMGVLAWTVLMTMLAGWFESAHRVVEALDDLFPAWDEPLRAEREAGSRIAKEATSLPRKRSTKKPTNETTDSQ